MGLNGDGYICLDGNSRLEILKKLEIKDIDCKIIEINSDEELKKFVTIYDNIKKKYKLSELHHDYLLNDEIISKLNLKLDLFNIKVKSIKVEDTVKDVEQFFLTLDSETCKRLRRKLLRKTFSEKEAFLLDKLNKKSNNDILTFILNGV